MTLYGVELIRLADEEEVASFVADELVAAARAGSSIVLTGGESPGRAYELAAKREPDWSEATLWWGDERAVPPDDERSNYRLADERLIRALAAHPTPIRIRGELGAQAAADEYDRFLDNILKGTFFTAQAAAKAMKAAGRGGAIVQTGSMWGLQAIGATPSSARVDSILVRTRSISA